MDKSNHTPKLNSFKTEIVDLSGEILAEWFSLTQRTKRERRAISRDLGHVLATNFCVACQFGKHCGSCVCCEVAR